MPKFINVILLTYIFIYSLSLSAKANDWSLIKPCDTHFLGLFELSNSTRISAVESLIVKQLDEVKNSQRFIKYDVEEIAIEVQQQFQNDAQQLSTLLYRLRNEYSLGQQVVLNNGKTLKGFAATEYIKIVMSRHIASLSGIDFLNELDTELDDLAKRFDQSFGKLSAINALVDNSPSDEVFSSACVALKELNELQINFPFKDATSLKLYALKQSEPISETALTAFLNGEDLRSRKLSFSENQFSKLMGWAKSLIP